MSRAYSHPKTKLIDLRELEKLCAIHATYDEIASWFSVSHNTIDNRVADKTPQDYEGEKLTFKEIMDRGYARGRISLRRKQMQLAEQGNPTMLVWLGKQILGQRDQLDQTLSAPGGGPVQVENHARDILASRIASIAARIGTDALAERTDPKPN